MDKLYETINERNWTKGAYTRSGLSGGSQHCLVGHMNLREVYVIGDHQRLLDAISVLFPERVEFLSDMLKAERFNDHEATTLEDVLRVCKLADV